VDSCIRPSSWTSFRSVYYYHPIWNFTIILHFFFSFFKLFWFCALSSLVLVSRFLSLFAASWLKLAAPLPHSPKIASFADPKEPFWDSSFPAPSLLLFNFILQYALIGTVYFQADFLVGSCILWLFALSSRSLTSSFLTRYVQSLSTQIWLGYLGSEGQQLILIL